MRRAVWGVTLLALASSVFAGRIDTTDIAPGAKWVAHLDVQGLLASQFGQYLLSQIRRDQPDFDSKMVGFQSVFGFDPTKDLASITLYGTEYQPASAVIIIKGTCNKEKLLGLLRQNPGYAETPYGNHVIYRWTQTPEDLQDDGVRRGAFYHDSVVVITRSEAGIKMALDVMDGKVAGTPSVVPPARPGVFLLAAAKDFTLPGNADPKAQILKRISGGTLEAGETGDTVFGSAKLVTRKPQDAQRVKQMLDGGLAFLSLVSEQTAEEKGQPPFWAPLLAGALAAGGDNWVELKVTVKTQALIGIANAARMADEAKKSEEAK